MLTTSSGLKVDLVVAREFDKEVRSCYVVSSVLVVVVIVADFRWGELPANLSSGLYSMSLRALPARNSHRSYAGSSRATGARIPVALLMLRGCTLPSLRLTFHW